jgi:RNA polymerase sigma factor (sigma-70 family)
MSTDQKARRGVGPDFDALWSEYAWRVQAYAMRHVGADVAEDVVGETFLIAWQRQAVVPSDAPLPWLLVVARNVIANHRRGVRRFDAAQDQAARLARLARPAGETDLTTEAREEALEVLSSLSQIEREAVLLTAWDGLAPPQAALVAGCSLNAFNVRLSRARSHISEAIDAPRGQRHEESIAPIERTWP